jgi:putative transposase
VVLVKDLTELTLEDLWKGVKADTDTVSASSADDWWEGVRQDVLVVVERLLEGTMEEEIIEQIRVAKYERGKMRRGYRNGYRYRSLLTDFGLLDVVKVPRDRDGEYQPRVLERYQRRQERVNGLVREMFLCGVSTRKVQEVLAPILGCPLSAQAVSRITRSLDGEVRRFHEQTLADHYQYLFLDGVTLKVKGVVGAKKKLVLCAYGIRTDGKRELISFRQATSESEAQWLAFLDDLRQRGLEGKTLRLITTDGCTGLHQALDTVYPYVKQQRCWAHKLRNVAAKLKRRHQKECLAGAKSVYQAATRREAAARFHLWAKDWRPQEPSAVACLEKDLDELLTFLDSPLEHWRKIRTTNVIERAFREIRRRTRPMSCFQNSDSVDRIIYGVIAHLNKSWKDKPLLESTHNT